MIEINKDTGRIYFYHLHKTDVPMRDFECISGYVCPECKNVLLAYFVGCIEKETIANCAERDSMKYAYEVGHSNGATWIQMQDYPHKEACKWQYVSARGILNGIKAFLKQYNSSVKDENRLTDAIEKGMGGFRVVFDVMDVDGPLLMYNDKDLVNTVGLSFDQKWKRLENIGAHLDSKLEDYENQALQSCI